MEKPAFPASWTAHYPTPENARHSQGGNITCNLRKIKTPLKISGVINAGELDSPFNLVGTEATGTSVHMARSTVHNGLNPLNIGLPGSVGTSVGVGDLDTEGNALATIITLCHSLHLLSIINS